MGFSWRPLGLNWLSVSLTRNAGVDKRGRGVEADRVSRLKIMFLRIRVEKGLCSLISMLRMWNKIS